MKYLLLMALLLSCSEDREVVREVPVGQPPPVDLPPPPTPPRAGQISFEAFENEVLTDLTGLVSSEQLNARYITVCDQTNAGRISPNFQRGVQKTLNQISLENRLEPGDWIGDLKCTVRIDLRDFGLTPSKWVAIERDDPLKFESFTDQGRLIKQLTQTRRAWIIGANFAETVLVNTYYELVETPLLLVDFYDQLGCDLQGDFDDFSQDLFLAGVRRSLIALQKNRTILMTECQEGTLASTYDFILERVTSPQRSLSINPFPPEARSNATAVEDAQEFIYTLPNGLLGYALFAKGKREDFAPTNIVVDNARPDIDPTITNSRSCSSCHASGLLPVEDFLADHVRGNPSFPARDVQKAEAYFGRNEAMKASISAFNQEYSASLSRINVGAGTDPINELTDTIRREMDAKQVAGMLFMTEQQFLSELPGSPGGTLAIGQLANGDTISFQDFILVKDVLVEDLNLFQEDLGQ